MAPKTARVDSADGRAELAQLNQIRLEENWSWRELAEDMRKAGYFVAHQTIVQLLKTPEQKPYDRTLYRIRQYLASRKAATRRPVHA